MCGLNTECWSYAIGGLVGSTAVRCWVQASACMST